MKKQPRLIVIAYVLAILFIFMIACLAHSYDSADHNGTVEHLRDGWFILDKNGQKVPFSGFGQPIDSETITLFRSLDYIIKEKGAIGFYNYYSAVDVYLDDVLLYQYGSQIDVLSRTMMGNFYSIVDLLGHEGKELKLVFRSSDVQTIYNIDVGPAAALEMYMIREYVPALFTPAISILFLIVSIVLMRKKTTKDLFTKRHQWLLMFCFAISFWEVADTQLLMDFGLNAGTVCLLSFESYMLLPIPLLMLVFHACPRFNKFDVPMCILVFVNFVTLNILQFAGIAGFLQTLVATHVIVALSLMLILAQIIVEAHANPSADTGFLLWGYAIFLFCIIAQYMSFFVNPAESNSKILQVGVLVFIIVQISSVLRIVNERIHQVTVNLETQTKFLRDTYKSFVPIDVEKSMTGAEEKILSMGNTVQMTVLESDIRGFSELILDMPANEAIDMLNHYFDEMTAILNRHDAIVLDYVGDAIMAIFDEEHAGAGHADKAVFAAVEMQMAMEEIAHWNAKHGYPDFEMGIGIHTGDAFVGYIGSKVRMEYNAIGATINLASRIETYSTGGQILISKDCKDSCTKDVKLSDSFVIKPKGFTGGMEVFLVEGIGAPYNLKCETSFILPGTICDPVKINFSRGESKHYEDGGYEGSIVAASYESAVISTETSLKLFDNIMINTNGPVVCKVVSKTDKGYLLRFTSVPRGFNMWDVKDYCEVETNEQ